jgi:hypothetical protein
VHTSRFAQVEIPQAPASLLAIRKPEEKIRETTEEIAKGNEK